VSQISRSAPLLTWLHGIEHARGIDERSAAFMPRQLQELRNFFLLAPLESGLGMHNDAAIAARGDGHCQGDQLTRFFAEFAGLELRRSGFGSRERCPATPSAVPIRVLIPCVLVPVHHHGFLLCELPIRRDYTPGRASVIFPFRPSCRVARENLRRASFFTRP